MTCLFLRLSLTNVYGNFLPGSHQYLLTAVNVFWAVGFIVANGVHLPNQILCTSFIILKNYRILDCLGSYPQILLWYIHYSLFQITITVSRLVHWFYSFGLCVSRCFWRARDTLLGKARIRRLLELCMSSRGIMGRRLIWLWNSS